MNDHHNSRFSEGFMLGLALGAALVFLLGTKAGKNLVKILSEQGLDGISDLLQEYDLGKIEEDDLVDEEEDIQNSDVQNAEAESSQPEKPRKRFFKRFKKSN